MSKKNSIVMESGKFLGAINNGLQARIALMEGRVAELGQQANAAWKLVSMSGEHLFIEDTKNNVYYIANHHRDKNNSSITIDNICKLRIVESKKKSLFEASCRQLIESIESNDQRGMSSAFNKMAGQRFTSRTVPVTGMVKTFDNVTRHIGVTTDSVIDESIRPRLVAAIVEGLSNRVTLREGVPVSGTFSSGKIKLPVTEWTCRKVVARYLRTVAESAYWSTGFQDRIYDVAKLIYNNKIEEAVKVMAKFLAEEQEFTTLDRAQTQTLVENTLATKACFNQQLCNDTASLFWRTNLKVNRDSILKEWNATAKKAAHATLLENVRILEETNNFEGAYDKFIKLVFNESVGPREVQVGAYRTALSALKDTPRIKESADLSGKIDELIERLEQPEQDHAVIAEVEDLLAEVKNEMNALETLDDYDRMPGGGPKPLGEDEGLVGDLGGDALGGDSGKQTVVNFNINIGKEGVDVGGMGEEEGGDEDLGIGEEEGGDELEDLLGGGGEEEEGGDELEDLLGGGGEEEGGDEEDELAKLLQGESRGRDRDPISENDDPYHYNGGSKLISGLGSDYGVEPIEIAEDCMKAVKVMLRLAEHNNLSGQALVERAQELADHGLKAAGIQVPDRHIERAREQVCDAFFEELDRLGIQLEDQRKGPWRHIWGRKKAALNRQESKKGSTQSEGRNRDFTVNEACVDEKGVDHCEPDGKPKSKPFKKGTPKVEWVEEENSGKKGYFGGIGFVFDHGGIDSGLNPVLLSNDGQVEVNVPTNLRESAFAAAEMSIGDPRPFMQWLVNNIEQFRPLNENDGLDDETISEAAVKITTTPDGGIQVEVDAEDPNVAMLDPEDQDMGVMGPDDEMVGGIDDVAAGMEPVETIPPEVDIEGGDIGPEIPDFGGDAGDESPVDDEEKSDEGGDESDSKGPPEDDKDEDKGPPEDDKDEEEKDDEGVVEDREMTTPTSKKYNTTKQDHRKEGSAKKPGKASDKIDGLGDGDPKTPGAKMKKISPKKRGSK